MTEGSLVSSPKRLRERASTRLLTGNLGEIQSMFNTWSENGLHAEVAVYLVQPGLKIEGSTAREGINLLLALSDQRLAQHNVSLLVVGS